MLEIHLSSEIFSSPSPSSSLLPSPDINENLHIVLKNNGTFQIVSALWSLIFNDKRLRSLSLKNLQLNQNDALILAKYFHEHNSLVKLTFDSVRGTIDVFNHIINEGLQNNTSIKRLTLSNLENLNTITIANLIKHNKHLECLFLSYDNLSADDAVIIADALRLNTKLQSIDLSHNHINKNGAFTFANLFHERHSSLTHINLTDNNIDYDSQQIIRTQCQNFIYITFSTETEPMLRLKQSLINIKSIPEKPQFLPIIFVTFLFFLWGIPHQLNDILIRPIYETFCIKSFCSRSCSINFFLWVILF